MQLDSTIAPQQTQPCSIALGYFDGVHIGHRDVISAAVSYANQNNCLPAVFTFALPPQSKVKGSRILSEQEKLRRLQQLGIVRCFEPPFEDIRQMTPQQFVQQYLKEHCGAQAVFCGENFTFGKDKAGTIEVLKTLCAECGIHLQVVPISWQGGAPVSSTRIRGLLEQGDIPAANTLLAQRYCVDSVIQHGAGNGKVWGFPTINQVFAPGMLIPKHGVYITQVQLQDGTRLPGATGLGTRPTVSGEGVTCETFLPGYEGDLYGQTVRVEFCKYLKPTVKFDSVDELKEYVFSAAQAALDYFKQN